MKVFNYVCVVFIVLCSVMPALAMQNNLFLLKALTAKTSAMAASAKADGKDQAQPSETAKPHVEREASKVPVGEKKDSQHLLNPFTWPKPRG